MALFFIDTANGKVATQHQLIEAGVMASGDLPPRPWLRIQGTGDATTMWYAVMRKHERGSFLGPLVMRHSSQHDLLRSQGWQEIGVEQISP